MSRKTGSPEREKAYLERSLKRYGARSSHFGDDALPNSAAVRTFMENARRAGRLGLDAQAIKDQGVLDSEIKEFGRFLRSHETTIIEG